MTGTPKGLDTKAILLRALQASARGELPEGIAQDIADLCDEIVGLRSGLTPAGPPDHPVAVTGTFHAAGAVPTRKRQYVGFELTPLDDR